MCVCFAVARNYLVVKISGISAARRNACSAAALRKPPTALLVFNAGAGERERASEAAAARPHAPNSRLRFAATRNTVV